MQINFRKANLDDLIANKTADNDYELVFEDGKGFGAIQSYSDMNDYLLTGAFADPTEIWTYDINESTYLSDWSTMPVNNSDGTYSFKLAVDPETSTIAYTSHILYLLSSCGISSKDFEFINLNLNVTMWDNGFIKSIEIIESYSMTISNILNTNLTLITYRDFSYYDDEEGFTPQDLTEMMSLSHNVA